MQIERFSRSRWVLWLKTAAIMLAAAALWLFWGDVIRELLTLIFGAAALAFLLAPLCKLLEHRLPRSIAAILSLIAGILILLLALALLLPSVLKQLHSLSGALTEAISQLQTLAAALLTRIQALLPDLQLPDFQSAADGGSLMKAAHGAISTMSGAADKIYRLFLMATLSYFLMSDRENILLRLELALPAVWRKSAVRAGNMLLRELKLYLRGQATIALAVGSIAAAALMLIGLSGAPLLGIIVGIFNMIPYFGPFLGGVPAVLTALGQGWQKAMLTILILFGVQQIDGMLISPRIMGGVTGFSPAVVMIALFIGGRIGNIGGMLLAVPVLMAIRTLYRVFVQRHENY